MTTLEVRPKKSRSLSNLGFKIIFYVRILANNETVYINEINNVNEEGI